MDCWCRICPMPHCLLKYSMWALHVDPCNDSICCLNNYSIMTQSPLPFVTRKFCLIELSTVGMIYKSLPPQKRSWQRSPTMIILTIILVRLMWHFTLGPNSPHLLFCVEQGLIYLKYLVITKVKLTFWIGNNLHCWHVKDLQNIFSKLAWHFIIKL